MRAAVVLAAGLMLLAGGPAGAAAREQGETAPAWAAAEEVRQSLFDAQLAAAGEDEDGAKRAVGEARRALRGALGEAVEGSAGREVRDAERGAERGAGQADGVGLAASRGRAEAALLGVSFERTLAAAARGDVEEAQEWLLLRDFRTATRFTRPGVGATVALDNLRARRIAPARARLGVAKDLLDAYQARLRELLADADRGGERGPRPRARRPPPRPPGTGASCAPATPRTAATAPRARPTAPLPPWRAPARRMTPAPTPTLAPPSTAPWMASWPRPSPPRSRPAAPRSSAASWPWCPSSTATARRMGV